MAQRLKRWESPRREGRNDKGRGGSARKRQRQKQLKLLAKKLKAQDQRSPDSKHSQSNHLPKEGRDLTISSLFYNRSYPNYGVLLSITIVSRSTAWVRFS